MKKTALLLLYLTSIPWFANTSTAGLNPFTSDGCSLFPDGNFKNNELWLKCCTAHDKRYWVGGTYEQRKQADLELERCVTEIGEPEIAKLMHNGVRLGGSPYWPTWYRWGYGWDGIRGYQALTIEERKQAERLLKQHSQPETRTPSDVKSDEDIIFFPATGYRVDNSTWKINIHGWIFEPETFGDITHLFHKALVMDQDKEDESIFRQRAHWFIVDNERNKTIRIRLGNTIHEMEKSGSNGHFQGNFLLNNNVVENLTLDNPGHGYLKFTVVLPRGDQRVISGLITLIDSTGISVISDIDDTIKISNVTDKKELLANTFMRPFQQAPGMSMLYQQWQKNNNAKFHYVSASPWQLYVPLKDFMQTHGFPTGSFHMKTFRWKDNSFFNLFSDPMAYKTEIIESLLRKFPQRKFILVGDSGEKDPEVYAAIAAKYPNQILRILIRNLDVNTDSKRFDLAFANVGKHVWAIFRNTDEINEIIFK
jgi:hypothetical protein